MPISAIATVLLRLLSLYVIIFGLSQLVVSIFHINRASEILQVLSFGSTFLFVGIITWLATPSISKYITKSCDDTASLEGISPLQFTTTGFLMLGMWMTLTEIPHLISWILFHLRDHEETENFFLSTPVYSLTESMLSTTVGIYFTLTAQRWAKKLTPA